jgi:hypothetical protein
LKMEGPFPPPEKPPPMAIITTLTRIPIAANIPEARNIILFGVIDITMNQTLKKRVNTKKRVTTQQLCQTDPILQNCLGHLYQLLL